MSEYPGVGCEDTGILLTVLDNVDFGFFHYTKYSGT